jgi:uncharacterized protein DUF6701
MNQLIDINVFFINKLKFYFLTLLFVAIPFSVQAASTTLTYSVSSDNDDAEEQGVGAGVPPASSGTMYLDSTDLELVYDGGTRQVVGVRFTDIAIKQGTTSITNAYIQFTRDENDNGATTIEVYGEDADDTVEFGTANGDITSRTPTSNIITWTSIPNWNGGSSDADRQTPDISGIIHEIVQRPGWSEFNSIVIMFRPAASCNSSACQRTAESHDGSSADAPQLVITLDDNDVADTLSYTVSQSSDDAEEQGAGVPGSAGSMDLTSTDLELVYEGNNRQVVGIRFQDIGILQGATVSNAYIQFTVDEDDSNTTNVVIYGEDEDDTLTFGSTAGDITGRTNTSASVNWNTIPAWSGGGTAGSDQRTPNLSSIINEIIGRSGWEVYNNLTFIFEPGTGCNSSDCQRTAESFDGTAPPQLVIELDASGIPNIIFSTTGNSTAGGQAITTDDAVDYEPSTDTGSLFFDGNATFDASNETLDAIHAINDGTGDLIISTGANASIDGNNFQNADVVRVTPSGTAGEYNFGSILFDESAYTDNFNFDALYLRDNGNIVFSMNNNSNRQLPRCGGGNLNFDDDDIVEWDVGSNCATRLINFGPIMSACSGNGDEDIDAVHFIGDNEDILLISLLRNCTIDGQTFNNGDVILYNNSTGTASLYMSRLEYTGTRNIDAVTLAVNSVSATVDHYDIDFSSAMGITCLPVDVTITAKDNTGGTGATINHTSLTTINFNTSTNLGQWGTPSSGTGTFSDPTPLTPDNGDFSYEFPIGESSVTIPLSYTEFAVAGNSETFEIDIYTSPDEDGGIADADDDPSVTFEFTAIIFNNVTDTNNTITTQISGKPSNTEFNAKTYNLQALNADEDDPSVCQSIFGNGDVVSIELGAECKNPTACAGRELNIDNINPALPASGIDIDTSADDSGALTVASYDAVDLQFGANAAAEIVLTYPDAGEIQLHARYELLLDDGVTGSGEYATGISNDFVVRPFGFALDTIEDSGAVANPAAVDATGTKFVKAGEDFVATVRAYNWGSGDDDGSVDATGCDLTIEPGCTGDDGIPDTNADLSDNNGGGVGAVTPNFQGTGAIDVTLSAVAPNSPSAGTLGNLEDSVTNLAPVITAASFSTGIETVSTIYYDEVGTMTLKATGTDYLSTGQAISGRSSNVAANPNNGSVGRFIPDRFLLSDNTPTFLNTCAVGSFTYMDEIFAYDTVPQITVSAVDTYGDPTVNYGDGGTAATDYWKLPTELIRSYDDNSTNNGSNFIWTATATVTLTGQDDFTDGAGVLSFNNTVGDRDTLMFDRSTIDLDATEGAPFTASIDLLIEVENGLNPSLYDTDDVCYDGDTDGTCEFDGSDDYTALTDSGGTALSLDQLRFGRLNIGTAAGSELLALSVPFQTEYFDGDGFVLNTDDGCTLIDDLPNPGGNGIPDLVLNNNIETNQTDGNIQICTGSTSTFTLANTTLVGGDGGLSFSAPGPGLNCKGYTDVTLDLTPLSLGHLLYDWDAVDQGSDSDFYDDNPTGRGDFGIFEGPKQHIYIREPW